MEFDIEQTDKLLSTTRAVRRRLDFERDVPDDLLLRCIELAEQAPAVRPFFEALANLHQTMEFQIRRRRGEEAPAPFDHPDAQTGVAGMRFIRAAVASSKNQGAWTTV